MKRISKKQETVQTSLFDEKPLTILSMMELITSDEQKISLDGDDVAPTDTHSEPGLEYAISYLQDRLGMSRVQVLITTNVLFHTAKHPGSSCDMDDLSNLMHIHPLRLMQLSNDFNQLETMGYIITCKTHSGDMAWRFTREAREALMKDMPFDVETIKLTCNIDFLAKSHYYVKDGMRYDQDGVIAKNIKRIMQQNPHLSVVQNLQKLENDNDMWFMLLMMTTLAVEEDSYVNTHDLEQMISGRILRAMLKHMREEKHPFTQKGYIEWYGQEGQAQANQWILTKEGWLAMLGNQDEVDIIVPQPEDENVNVLSSYQNLTHKTLYFSGKTKEQVERLTNLLQEKQYAHVCQALKKRGMPTGFCCLFYGVPGTGKTELVQQLAIATQRDLLQVNMATLRDKYVGESEKQIKRIFDKYRALVRSQERAPILFFNEADAILGNRLENTQRAVDKMENAIQNIILQEMEVLDGIMICTTNLTSCLDKAFDRRFLFKLEFEKPTNEARKLIWQSLLDGLNDEQATELANRFDFSGGQIQNISRKQVINAIFSGNDNIDYEQVKLDCQNETISRSSRPKVGF